MDVDVGQGDAALYVRRVGEALLVEVVQLEEFARTRNVLLVDERPLLGDDLITEVEVLVVGRDDHVLLAQLQLSHHVIRLHLHVLEFQLVHLAQQIEHLLLVLVAELLRQHLK